MPQAAAQPKLEQPHKGSRRRVRLFMIFVLGFVAWAAVIAWNQQARLDAKSAQASELETKRAETQKLNADYKKEVERLNDPEYILQKIRKEYHYTKPGETLFYTPKS